MSTPGQRYRMDLAYDGTDFSGWQYQKNARSVQEELERALSQILDEPVRITGSGRTDRGVHARRQVAHFDVGSKDPGERAYFAGLNSILPKDIRILEVRKSSADFHARFSAKQRMYHYHLLPAQVGLPWEEPYVWKVYNMPGLNELNALARVLVGTHDFTSLCAAQDPNESRVRHIFSSAFFPRGSGLIYRIAGTAFLWKMVRTIVGTILDLAQKGQGPENMRELLALRDRRQAGRTAPARGLFLENVIYQGEDCGL